MKPDNRDQKTKFHWYCEDCRFIIKITSVHLHHLNGHRVSQVNYEPPTKEELKKKKWLDKYRE